MRRLRRTLTYLLTYVVRRVAYRRLSHHRVRLAWSGLSVGEHADVVSQERRIQHLRTELRVHLATHTHTHTHTDIQLHRRRTVTLLMPPRTAWTAHIGAATSARSSAQFSPTNDSYTVQAPWHTVDYAQSVSEFLGGHFQESGRGYFGRPWPSVLPNVDPTHHKGDWRRISVHDMRLRWRAWNPTPPDNSWLSRH